MSEQDLAPEIPDSPTDAAPDVDSQPAAPEPIVDWQKRATDNQAWATRLAQEKSELEARLAGLEAQAQPDSPEYDEDFEYDFEDSVARQELAEIKALLQQQQEQAKAEDEFSYITGEIEAIEAKTGRQLSNKASDWIGRFAQQLPRTEQGNPDVQAAYQEWLDAVEEEKKVWASGKRADRPAAGPGAVEVPDLDDPEQREQYIDRLMSGE